MGHNRAYMQVYGTGIMCGEMFNNVRARRNLKTIFQAHSDFLVLDNSLC